MAWHTGWWSYLSSTDEKPKVTWALLRRVLGYSRPYRWQIAGMLAMILVSTGLALLTPLIMRDLIDRTIPAGDLRRLVCWRWRCCSSLPSAALVSVIQRRLNARVGEGVIYDLRVALYARLQRMSLRFFTNTKVGELMSRLNNDVVGAQNAISNTIVGIVTNIIQAAAVLAVMLTLEWRLTLISVVILPLFILAARRLGARLRDIARQQMEANAQMNAMMNETLNIGGALLVKLFGRAAAGECSASSERAGAGARPGRPPGGAGRVVLRHHRPGQRRGHGAGLRPGRLPGHPGRLHRRHHRGLRRLPGQPVRRAAGAGQRAGGVCHLDGQLRARL